jgi:hypothetical protein
MWDILKDFGALKTFSKKWRLLYRLFEHISIEMEAFVWNKCGAFIKISIIFESFFKDFEAFKIRF